MLIIRNPSLLLIPRALRSPEFLTLCHYPGKPSFHPLTSTLWFHPGHPPRDGIQELSKLIGGLGPATRILGILLSDLRLYINNNALTRTITFAHCQAPKTCLSGCPKAEHSVDKGMRGAKWRAGPLMNNTSDSTRSRLLYLLIVVPYG